MHLLQNCQSQPRMVNCTPLHSIPKPFRLQNSTMMCMTKSYLWFLKPSNDASIIWRLCTPNQCGHWSQNLQYFSTTKILMRHQACWSEYLSAFNLVIWFRPGSSAPNPMHLLDNGTSILKREVATMPVLTYRTFAQCLHPNNWHRPSSYHLTIPALRDPHYGCKRLHADIWTQCQEDPCPNTPRYSIRPKLDPWPMTTPSLRSDLCPEYW